MLKPFLLSEKSEWTDFSVRALTQFLLWTTVAAHFTLLLRSLFGRVGLKSELLFDFSLFVRTNKSHQNSKYLYFLLGIHSVNNSVPQIEIYYFSVTLQFIYFKTPFTVLCVEVLCLHAYLTSYSCNAIGSPKRAPDPLKLEATGLSQLWPAMWVLGTEQPSEEQPEFLSTVSSLQSTICFFNWSPCTNTFMLMLPVSYKNWNI